MNEEALAFNRRSFVECFSAAGLALMPGALLAVAQDSRRITPEMLNAAEKIAGIFFTREEQQAILARLNSISVSSASSRLPQPLHLSPCCKVRWV